MPRLSDLKFNNITGQLNGIIYDDNRFPDGCYVTTTSVVDIDNITVTTRSGTKYILEPGWKDAHVIDEVERYLAFHKTTQHKHSELVGNLVKDPSDIIDTLDADKVNMIHAVLGIAGEAGELVDAIKKSAIYNKPLDLENVVEELGDLEFYMEQLRQQIDVSREEILLQNIRKLSKRYPSGYTDAHASLRLDKEVSYE